LESASTVPSEVVAVEMVEPVAAAGPLLVAGAELFVAAAPQAASMAAPAKVRTIRCIKRTSAVGRCK
jgi:hypothetical protein